MNSLISFFKVINPLLIIVISTLITFFADWLAKLFANTQNEKYLIFAMILYPCSSFLFVMTLFSKGVTIANILRNVISIGFALILGLLIFREQITYTQRAGLILCIVGMILIEH